MGWQDQAACRGSADPEQFFPVGSGEAAIRQIQRVTAVCRSCSVRQECLDEAVQKGHIGIWGGTDEAERRRIRARRVGTTRR